MRAWMECGINTGIDQMARLTKKLLDKNQVEDLKRGAADKEYWNELLKKYKIVS